MRPKTDRAQAIAAPGGVKTVRLSPNVEVAGCMAENGRLFAVPPTGQPARFAGQKLLWVFRPGGGGVLLRTKSYRVKRTKKAVFLTLACPYQKVRFSALPPCDFTGNRFSFTVGGHDLTGTAAGLYWKNLVPECAERTLMRKNKTWRDGYVLSTLELSVYAGTYPAVDHEFHIRGRLALGGQLETDVVRRMLELQFRTMAKDCRTRRRIPCSVQRSGRREYRVLRKSEDGKTKAQMFPLTGILELCEELYAYFCQTKDTAFLQAHIEELERGLALAEEKTDANGRLWSDVYYEDQVIKDGAAAQAQAFAVLAFSRAAFLERILSRETQAAHYETLAEKLQENYIKPLPVGFWNEESGRYADWVDRKGNVHDHIHLLANALPVTLGFHKGRLKARDEKIVKMIYENDGVFQKFPSFVAAKVEDYTPSEIGVGGPYDLCAAGRYWCHDAKLRSCLGDAKTLQNQLLAVAEEAEKNGHYLFERYDMNHVYYNTGPAGEKPSHGAARYYEYPCVFLDVLLRSFFGVRPDEKSDFTITPCCTANSRMVLQSAGLELAFDGKALTVKNTAAAPKKLHIDPAKILPGCRARSVTLKPGEEYTFKEETICSNHP